MCCLLRLYLGDEGCGEFWWEELEVGKNWVMGISVVINKGAGKIIRVKGTGGFVRFVCKGRVCRVVGVMKLVCLRV